MKKTCSRGHVFEKTGDCPTCPSCWPKLKLLAATDFPDGLSAPALRALDHAGVRSLTQLTKRTERDIAALHGMGPKGIAMLEAAPRRKKLSFRPA